jgi:Fe-S cluster assembly iron-binding protein IscA
MNKIITVILIMLIISCDDEQDLGTDPGYIKTNEWIFNSDDSTYFLDFSFVCNQESEDDYIKRYSSQYDCEKIKLHIKTFDVKMDGQDSIITDGFEIYFDSKAGDDWENWEIDYHGAKMTVVPNAPRIRLVLSEVPNNFINLYFYLEILHERYYQ